MVDDQVEFYRAALSLMRAHARAGVPVFTLQRYVQSYAWVAVELHREVLAARQLGTGGAVRVGDTNG